MAQGVIKRSIAQALNTPKGVKADKSFDHTMMAFANELSNLLRKYHLVMVSMEPESGLNVNPMSTGGCMVVPHTVTDSTDLKESIFALHHMNNGDVLVTEGRYRILTGDE